MGLRLLIVDDNAIQIKSVLSYVDWEKYHVSEIRKAFDGEEGFAIAKEFEPQLIITDVDMPKLNGIELAKKLRAINSKAEFIFITCHESFQFAHEAISLRAKAYILKSPSREISMTPFTSISAAARSSSPSRRRSESFWARTRATGLAPSWRSSSPALSRPSSLRSSASRCCASKVTISPSPRSALRRSSAPCSSGTALA